MIKGVDKLSLKYHQLKKTLNRLEENNIYDINEKQEILHTAIEKNAKAWKNNFTKQISFESQKQNWNALRN